MKLTLRCALPGKKCRIARVVPKCCHLICKFMLFLPDKNGGPQQKQSNRPNRDWIEKILATPKDNQNEQIQCQTNEIQLHHHQIRSLGRRRRPRGGIWLLSTNEQIQWQTYQIQPLSNQISPRGRLRRPRKRIWWWRAANFDKSSC